MDVSWDITVKDVERRGQFLTPTIHTLPNLEPVVQPCMPLEPVHDKEKIVMEKEQTMIISSTQHGVMQALTPQIVYITPLDDDYVAPATSPTLDKQLNKLGKECSDITRVAEKENGNLVKDVQELSDIKTYDCETFIRKLLHQGSGFELTAFSDADHAGCVDTRKSTSGGIQFLGDKLVSWMSKKQDCTAMSSAEAEYVALSASCAQVMWMRTQLKDYGFNYNKIPLYCDSQSAIAISCNPVQHSRTKHIHTRYHFIKEQVENGIIELYFVRTEYQLADMFTKALPEDRFQYLVRQIGMRCLTPAELEVLTKESA
ncbi:hypothetical protein Tco_0469707 [Tanacetum coccineum]